MINNACNCLMMVEPKDDATLPINDELTEIAKAVWESRKKEGADLGSSCRGFHVCICGKMSDNIDWRINGMTTNSLLVHYVQCHRNEVPEDEIIKLRMLHSNLFPKMR